MVKKFIKWAIVALLAIVILGFGAFWLWANATYGPSEQLQQLVDVDSVLQDDVVVLEPQDANGVGIIIYPGAKVEPTAYSYYGQLLMEQGYTVVIPEMRFNFALFSAERAEQYMKQFDSVDNWVVGGHSLGGVAAAMFAAEHEVDGLLFLGSYPSASSDLSKSQLPVLSLYAQFDGLTLVSDIEDSKALLPASASFVEIKGGNHAQFGMYGEQKGDGAATISALDQQEQMVQETLAWLQMNIQ